MSIIIFIFILLVLVLVHEFGHFIVAKKNGIRVDEFGFGFPPRAMTLFTKGETKYTLNWIPFGGFVKIFGETPDENSINGPDASRSFVNKSKWTQAAVLFAGIFFNILLAWVLFSVGFIAGMPSSSAGVSDESMLVNQKLTLISIMPDGPADRAGLEPGDIVVSLSDEAGVVIKDPNIENIISFVGGHPNETIYVEYDRHGELYTAPIVPELGIVSESVGGIGISPDMVGTLKLPVHKALWQGAKLTVNATVAVAVGFFTLIKDSIVGQADLSSISGPVGLVGIVGDAYRFGITYLISFVAFISINLAVLNLVPFPALDGGRLLFLGIEAIKGSPLSPKFANIANAVGFLILILLMLVVTWNDISKLI